MAQLLRAVANMGLTELEQAVTKATWEDDLKPKQKHVDALIRTCLRNPSLDLLAYIKPRLAESSWHVVLKSLVVIHRLMNDGAENFLNICAAQSRLLDMSAFNDRRTTLAWAMSRLIHLYGEFLVEKANSYVKTQYSPERATAKENAKWAMALTLERFFICLPQYQILFQKLLDCTPYTEDDQAHPIASASTALVIRDAFRIYSLLTVMIFVILERFQKMDKKQCNASISCVRAYMEQSEKTKKWTDVLVKLGLADGKLLPKFDNVPNGFIQLLEDRIKGIDEEDTYKTATLSDTEDKPKKKPGTKKKIEGSPSSPALSPGPDTTEKKPPSQPASPKARGSPAPAATATPASASASAPAPAPASRQLDLLFDPIGSSSSSSSSSAQPSTQHRKVDDPFDLSDVLGLTSSPPPSRPQQQQQQHQQQQNRTTSSPLSDKDDDAFSGPAVTADDLFDPFEAASKPLPQTHHSAQQQQPKTQTQASAGFDNDPFGEFGTSAGGGGGQKKSNDPFEFL